MHKFSIFLGEKVVYKCVTGCELITVCIPLHWMITGSSYGLTS